MYPNNYTTEDYIADHGTAFSNKSLASDFNISYNIFYNDSRPRTYICEFQHPEEHTTPKTIFKACVFILYGAVFIVALLGNGLVCFVVHTTPKMKTVTNYFIVNLAIGDILMTVFCVPFSSASTLVLKYWPFGGVMCKMVNYSQAVSVLVSAYTLLAISIDRYIIIMRPLKPRVEKRVAKLVVVTVWVGALVTAAPIPVVSQLQKPSDWHVVCNESICAEQWWSAEQSAQYTCALLTLQFVAPLCALVATYARIAHVVWGGRPPGEAHNARDSRMANSKRKMVKMMITVVIVFTICWLPLNIFMVLWSVHEDDESWNRWPGMPYVWFASHWLAMSHSCYNPIIYCYMNARYRRGFKQALKLLFCPWKTHAPSGARSSFCEGIPLSEKLGVNGIAMHRRSFLDCHCGGSNVSGTCARCMSLRHLKLNNTRAHLAKTEHF